MIEETDSIITEQPSFTRYLGIVEAMLASQSNELYAGPIVAALGAATGLRTIRDQVRRLKVANADAARMFVMNMQAWKHGDFIRTNYPNETVRESRTNCQRSRRQHRPRRTSNGACARRFSVRSGECT